MCSLEFRFCADELTQIVTDVVADPTLPRTEDHECPKYVNFSFWVNLIHKLARLSLMFSIVEQLVLIDGEIILKQISF